MTTIDLISEEASTPTVYFRNSIFVAWAIAAVGCSTLDVQDGYALSDKSVLLQPSITDGELRVAFEPTTRLFAVGVLGIPLIPTVVRTRPMDEFNLYVEMTVHAEHEFSFAGDHCLQEASGSQICSNQTSIHAVALWQDDGTAYRDKQPRWNHILQFFQTNRPYYLPITDRPKELGINRDTIYKLYDYQESPKWGYLKLELLYHFTCAERCPPEFTIKDPVIVTIDNSPVDIGVHQFHRARLKGYSAIEPLQ